MKLMSCCLLKAGGKFILILLLISLHSFSYCQQRKSTIQFVPKYDSLPIEIGKKYPYKNDSVEIETLKFYISGIQFFQNEKLVAVAEKKYHLFDIENPATQYIYQPNEKNIQFNRLHFSIGIDSITNEAGAIGDDLDPTNGMYWTWQSGYINFKLEGKTKICPARNHQFTFHIGGYQYPYNAIQNLDMVVSNNEKIVVSFDVSELLSQLNLAEVYEVMSPNEKAMMLSKKIGTAFSIVQ